MEKIISANKLITIIEGLLSKRSSVTIALDGRCASGKTTIGNMLSSHFGANLFHADDYFLRPFQRTEERLSLPGGNFDIERFSEEIIEGIKSRQNFSYSPFDCSTMSVAEPVFVKHNEVNIIEGSYSCHPQISKNYDLRVFITTDEKTQRERVLKRNPDKAEMFFSKWIPLEEKYLSHHEIEKSCDFIIIT